MFKGKLFMAGILAVVMSLAAACTPAELQALQGTLQNIDSVSGNITVKLKDGTTQSFNLTDVKVSTIRQALGNANLEIGDQIVVKARKGGEVEEVETERAEVGGVIKSLGTGNGTNNITITTKKQGDIMLTVTPNTTIHNRGAANFSSIQVGQRVEVKYDVTTKAALRINVNNEDATGEAEGIIQAVNNTTMTVTIATNKSGNITVTVTANTSIRIEDKRTATFADLKVGQRVEVRYDVATKTAIKLSAEDDEEDHKGKGNAQDNQGNQNRGKDKD